MNKTHESKIKQPKTNLLLKMLKLEGNGEGIKETAIINMYC